MKIRFGGCLLWKRTLMGFVMESGSPGPCPGHGPDARPVSFQGMRGNMGSRVYKALCLGRCVAAAYASSLMEWTA